MKKYIEKEKLGKYLDDGWVQIKDEDRTLMDEVIFEDSFVLVEHKTAKDPYLITSKEKIKRGTDSLLRR